MKYLLSIFILAMAFSAHATESAFERVMRTQTIRCSYVPYSPANIVDPNTNEQTGILHDAAEEIGNILNLKVEWVEEATWATFMESLKTGRADVFCGAAFAFPVELGIGEHIGPFYYSPITLWTRKDDHRFDESIDKVNDPTVTVAGEDGSIAAKLQERLFPKAKLLGLPHAAPYSLKLDNVTQKKADITLVETSVGLDYIANNPDTLRNATPTAPITVYPNMFVVNKGEHNLRTMLQGAVNILHNDGTIEKLIKKYEKYPNNFYRVAKPYEVPQ
jgi:ABC-type amino acid transport substrate-binding protein